MYLHTHVHVCINPDSHGISPHFAVRFSSQIYVLSLQSQEATFWNLFLFSYPRWLCIQRYLRTLFVNLITSTSVGLKRDDKWPIGPGNAVFCESREYVMNFILSFRSAITSVRPLGQYCTSHSTATSPQSRDKMRCAQCMWLAAMDGRAEH